MVPQRYGRQGEGGGSQWLGLMDRRSYALTLSKGGRSEHFLAIQSTRVVEGKAS